MEPSTSNYIIETGQVSPNTQRVQSLNRANRPLQLPTVCVSTIPPTLSSVVAAVVTNSPLNSPVFVDTNNPSSSTNSSTNPTTTTQQQVNDLHAFRLASGGATSAMLHERWFSECRHERTSSSSSDSGVIFQFSPPAGTLGPCPSSASLSISPPGLSPLQLDSAFSTPTPSSANRFRSHFTFDHINSPRRKPENPFDIALVQQQQQQTSAAMMNEIIKRASNSSTSSSGVTSGSISSTTDIEEEIKRKQEEIVATANLLQPQIKNSVFRSESLPAVRFPSQSDVEKMMQFYQTQVRTQPPQQQQPQQQLLPRASVVRTTSLNVQTPSQFLTTWTAVREQSNQIRPFGSLQSAFKAPNLLSTTTTSTYTSNTQTNTLNNPPMIQTTAPSPPQRVRRKTKSSSGNNNDDSEDSKKQYFCTTCNKDFRRPDILSRHLRRHTGEKPFGCESCGRFFSRSDHLRTHRRTHTDEKPYKCTVCPYAARRRDVLTRHMSTRHQQKAERTFFPRQRRCLSESITKTQKLKEIKKSEVIIKDEIIESSKQRQRCITEIPKIEVKEEIINNDEDDEIIDVLNIEDDVVIDTINDKITNIKKEENKS